jgi:transposase-like protein
VLWLPYVDGVPFRKLGNEYGLSGVQAYARVITELNTLPDNTKLTKQVCDTRAFSGFLIMDGKYVKTRGFKKGAPLIWGIDYLTHDIPAGILARAEDESEFVRFFRALATTGYYPTVVVGDDRKGLKQALYKVFPLSRFQLCQVHFLENVRRYLGVRQDATHQHFFNSLKLHVFMEPKTIEQVVPALRYVRDKHTLLNPMRQAVILQVKARLPDLFTYLTVPDCPNNTNLIELYNSHLNARLKSIKGFKSFVAARRFTNAYIIRRRTKPLTDCEQTFRHLNGYASLQLIIKKQALWPDISGVKPPKKALKTER